MTTNQTTPRLDVDDRPSNLAVLRGSVANDPIERELPSGDVVVHFDLVTRLDQGGRSMNISVPVAWNNPPTSIVAVGIEIVVIGTVRRRFFRVGGATQSRTEVAATHVLPTRRRKQVDAALASVAASLVRGG